MVHAIIVVLAIDDTDSGCGDVVAVGDGVIALVIRDDGGHWCCTLVMAVVVVIVCVGAVVVVDTRG